jgi:hypothetical protein
MNHLTPIFKLADILHTPKGIALAGVFGGDHQQLENVLDDLEQSINGLNSLAYIDFSQELISLSVKEIQYTTSISNGINLFFLLDGDRLPDNLTIGTTIYRNEQSDSVPFAKLSASSI